MARWPFGYDRKRFTLALSGLFTLLSLLAAMLLLAVRVRDEAPLSAGQLAPLFRAYPDRIGGDSAPSATCAGRVEEAHFLGSRAGSTARRFTPFPFDVNALDSAGFVRLGFTARQASSIVRYRASRRGFRAKPDLLLAYAVDSAAYQQLEPYMRIGAYTAARDPLRRRFTPFPFDPNSLDSVGFVRLGFAPREAQSIIRYRARIVRFAEKDDFLRAYAVDSLAFSILAPYMLMEP